MADELNIRRFAETDAEPVKRLFITVNRGLAPAHLKAVFESYISQSLRQEIDCISDYYDRHGGRFWIAEFGAVLVAMMGLERHGKNAMELRRMYVDPVARRQGIAKKMLSFAEHQSRLCGAAYLYLSTSEMQQAALSLYKSNGYELLCEDIANDASNKTIGAGIRRYYFKKSLASS